ncbi:hypothetical protein LEP48_12520 [Isoptericola sp. NEAU-Y5]|uniref:Small CPxCG-related zinc finger protein n=1 Tax=Isoptericola luteus TaxID=2879484 RepID=A0ABS7ZGL0_9MICO|nr:hypothetical protein [Isoptericola sp. NEAU-Y5]MCA5894164.1 hypothetical protein [Isoptericola sp. NEAU-Y5]
MSNDSWNRIFRLVHDGDSGPWLCPVCDFDDPTVELGQRFMGAGVVRSTVYCNACTAHAQVPDRHGVDRVK